jgi:hypothetical protein
MQLVASPAKIVYHAAAVDSDRSEYWNAGPETTMSIRISLVMLTLLMCCGICHAQAERWSNFAEDSDLRYYIDHRSIISLPDNVYIFWVKSVAKDREYFKNEYNVSTVSYQLTNYELDCAVSSYRVRGTILFDKSRKELSKSVPESEPAFEPIPPESVLELAQDEICVKGKGSVETPEEGEGASVVPKAPSAPEAPTAPEAPEAPRAPAEPEEPPALQ